MHADRDSSRLSSFRGLWLTLVVMCFGACAREPAARISDSPTADVKTPADTQSDSLSTSGPLRGGRIRVIGNEPFWSVLIDTSGIVYVTPENQRGIHFPLPPGIRDGAALRWKASATGLEGRPNVIDVMIRPGDCSDGMSDKRWTHRATVTIDDRVLMGCAEWQFK